MAYIEREKVCEICNNKGVDCGKEKCPVYKVPTADVAPRAEVEQLERNLAQCENGYSQEMHLLQCKLTNAKSEVARAIFRDIAIMGVLQHGFNEEHIVMHIDFELLKELKKKYTEEKENV